MSQPEIVKIIIPSHKRHDTITTHAIVSNAAVCIPESQLPEYRERLNSSIEIITHPDSIIGLNRKRQWINDTFDNVFTLDDDILGMMRIWDNVEGMSAKVKLTPDEAYDRIQLTAQLAKDLKSFMFGFNNTSHPLNYSPDQPFTFTGYRNIYACGFLNWKNSNLFFHEEAITGQDYWICGLNAFVNRYFIFDDIFGFLQKDTFVNKGGLSEFRSMDQEKRTYIFLKRMFGSAIRRKKMSGKITKQSHKYLRHLDIPF